MHPAGKKFLRFFLDRDELIDEDLEALNFRHKFSRYLPYRVYDPDTEAYLNIDNSFGYIWECTPLVYANDQTFGLIEGLFNQVFPDNTVLQFILHADPYINPTLDAFRSLKTRPDDLSQRAADSTMTFFRQGTKGVDKLQGIPVRNFRLYVALKLPVSDRMNEYNDLKNNVFEILKGIHVHPRSLPPEALINILGRIFNPDLPVIAYDPMQFINKQILTSETPVSESFNHLCMGEKIWRCQTVKQMPGFVDNLTFNLLNGDIWGVTGDANQINHPFIMTVNIIFQDLTSVLHRKCNFVMNQKAVGSLSATLVSKQAEYTIAVGELERGARYLRIMPIIFHQADTPEASKKCSARIKRIWQGRNFIPQEDRGILKILWLSALPLGLYTDKKSVDFLDRDFICPPKAAAKCLPIQADFMGGGTPYCLFVGRKGQLIHCDLFAKQANNANCLVAASSGAGKSFFVNSLCYNYYSAGALVRLIDIGRSYKKLCNMVGGKYIEFTKDSHICLNPFTYIDKGDAEDVSQALNTTRAVIAQMIYSSSGKSPTETESTLISAAVRAVFQRYGTEAGIDHVYEYLKSPAKSLDEIADLDCSNDATCIADIKKAAVELAFNLRSFTSAGQFGKWFNGPATLNFSQDEFVVLELEELAQNPEMFKVVTLQLINYVTADVYLSGDRTRNRLIIFDEAWQFFRSGDGEEHGSSGLLANVIEEGYRRARKYNSSFLCVVQSLLDMIGFGPIGRVIMANSAYKFFLESPDFTKARSEELIDYDEFTMDILKSITSPRPNYSEIFMQTPLGTGVGRLVVDPFLYYLATSDARETAAIEKMVKHDGLTYTEAIDHMIRT